jgi:hypothetical protein
MLTVSLTATLCATVFINGVVFLIPALKAERHMGLAEGAAAAITGDNGLPFIAIPEYAGPFWSGRALGAQHTAERLVFAAAPPVFGALITAVGYPLTFAVCGLFP